jgi:DMSO/TMAO reductase YedYZ heme-binding membrane subunit
MKLNIRKTIQVLAYYIIPAFFLLNIIIKIYLGENLYKELKDYGNYVFILLLIILFVKPISIIFNEIKIFKTVLGYRRELGILAFWFSIFHSIGLMYYLDLFSVQGFIKILTPNELKLLSGFLAFIGMFILGITSNKLAVLKLKNNWKKIQSIVYPTFFFVAVHKSLSEKEFGPIIIFLIYVVFKIIEYLKLKNKKLNKNII